MQGSSSSARLGGKAKYVCIVGLGKKEKASSPPEWGPSPFQVCIFWRLITAPQSILHAFLASAHALTSLRGLGIQLTLWNGTGAGWLLQEDR